MVAVTSYGGFLVVVCMMVNLLKTVLIQTLEVFLPWVSKFVIRPSETTGRLYQNSGQTGDYYLTKPAFGVVFLKQANEYSDTLTLGSADDLPSLEIVNIGPNGGSNFIGYSPNKPSTVSVVHGLSASDASAFSESDSTSDDSINSW